MKKTSTDLECSTNLFCRPQIMAFEFQEVFSPFIFHGNNTTPLYSSYVASILRTLKRKVFDVD